MYKEVKKIQREFLWGWEHESRKIPWVKWDTLCKANEEGRMRVKDLKLFIYAFVSKWKWRLGCEERGLSDQVLESKYGSWRSVNNFGNDRQKSRRWRDLKSIWFDKNIVWRLGRGDRIQFWDDIWVGQNALIKILMLDFMSIAWIRKLLWVRLGDGMIVFGSEIWREGESGFSGRKTKLIKCL